MEAQFQIFYTCQYRRTDGNAVGVKVWEMRGSHPAKISKFPEWEVLACQTRQLLRKSLDLLTPPAGMYVRDYAYKADRLHNPRTKTLTEISIH
jgi:hypothetical protein